MQALFVYGLGTSHAKSSITAIEKKRAWPYGKASQVKGKNEGDLLYHTAILAARTNPFFSTASITLLSCPVQLGRLNYFLFPAGLRIKPHTNKKCLHGLWPALILCGGQRRPAMPVIRARLLAAQAPPHPHTPVLRAPGTHSDLCYSKVYHD